jgi:hypothetical protein
MLCKIEVFTAVTDECRHMGCDCRAVVVTSDVSVERIASVITMKRIGKLETLSVTSNC